ncbi:type I polyketide synthase [Nocardiopsis aegyptia]|uniref:type I polyketide synthase n=1 Tax=Nocardiopsis aegyptia TaxID=220378 RepID=UPI0036734DC0
MTIDDAHDGPPDAIAVIGMAGRFPQAPDTDALWDHLLLGHDAVTPVDGEGARTRAKGVLSGHDLFDAAFFGVSPMEAERTDPQHRLFLETAWQALEQAGHGAAGNRPVTGLFAGSSMSTYLLDVLASPRHRDVLDDSQLLIGCDKDYLATRIAHRLDLRGPAVVVQSACSTSLVAVHMAGQALLAGECDMALAGGVAVRGESGLDRRADRPDGMVSPAGRCRAFDASANGMVSGDGVGAVVLRRLDDALRDGDRVHAVIRGSAVNNDGAVKAGYTAPGVAGQVAVIRAAHAVAGVDPATIGFVEAHGTGTRLGDPIEVAALAEAFGPAGGRESCALGSVKTNIGHLDAAAGVVSLIKAVLAVREGVIPPTLHFERPNPELRLESTPFHVNTEPIPWRPDSGARRAGVSSFGIGGTNAHVVLEQAPTAPRTDPGRSWQLVPVSARTPGARDRALADIGRALAHSDDVADAAHTLQTGREEFEYRGAMVVATGAHAGSGTYSDAGTYTGATGGGRAHRPVLGRAGAPLPVAYLFPGQGSQYPGMAASLYAAEPLFRDELDLCADAVREAGGPDPRAALGLPGAHDTGRPVPDLDRTDVTQPMLFAVGYALARLWTAWGIEPHLLLGHSLGELTAACVAGVMSREDGARLVVARGAAMLACRSGAMTAVALPESALSDALPPQVEIAAVNTRFQTVVSGPEPGIAALEAELDRREARYTRLRTRRAFHSAAMEPAVEAVTRVAADLPLAKPQLTVLSNVTGRPLTADEATDPAYWGRQLRAPVRFADGVDHLAASGPYLAVETGPGATLRGMLADLGREGTPTETVCSLPGPGRQADELRFALTSLARLWVRGAPVRWSGLHGGRRRRRVPLPTYPFERRRYAVEPAPLTGSDEERPTREPATPAAHAQGAEEGTATEPELNETERLIAQVWERLLGTAVTGPDESFFDLGGTSLIGLHVLDELSGLFGVPLPKAAVYESPTVGELALLIEEVLVDALEQQAEDDVRRADGPRTDDTHATEVTR